MTDLKLLATQALEDSEAATPGPWIADRSPAGYSNVLLEPGTLIMSGDADPRCWPDAHFIASARTALPSLARGYLEAAVERDEAIIERDAARAAVERLTDDNVGCWWQLTHLSTVITERDAAQATADSWRASALSWQRRETEAHAERDAARAEVERLTSCLKRANAGTEHFEQAWNLVQDERDEARTALRTACELLNGYIPDPPRHPTHAQDRADIAVLRTRGGV